MYKLKFACVHKVSMAMNVKLLRHLHVLFMLSIHLSTKVATKKIVLTTRTRSKASTHATLLTSAVVIMCQHPYYANGYNLMAHSRKSKNQSGMIIRMSYRNR